METPARSAQANARISLEQCRKQAKDLVKAFKAGDARALDRIRFIHPRFRGKSDSELRQQRFVLADAQLVVARLQHLASWPKLLAYLQALGSPDPAVRCFEQAIDAIISGDVAALRAMLRDDPGLVHQRSTRVHRSTLLHYVSANGVEDVRQVTPANIVDVARILLDAGAEVDAESEAYGGRSTTLGLTATSAHPRLAGVQLALMDLLIDRGAVIGEVAPGRGMVHDAVANGCPEAGAHLVERGAWLDTIIGAAGVGRLDVVRELFPSANAAAREGALLMAAQCNRTAVVEFLLDHDVSAQAFDGMTPLHWAAANGNIAMMEILVSRGAPLEALNEFGGTVLSSTIWFAFHALDAEFARRDYPRAIDWLIAAGARVDFYPEMLQHIEEIRRRR